MKESTVETGVAEGRATGRKRDGRMVLTFVGLAFLIAATLTYFSYRDALDAAHARISSGSRMATTACGPIEYAVAGTGPPVLMVHGSGGGFDQGLDFAHPLIDQGFRVIAPSRFGYLRSPFPADPSPAAQADAHACLLDALNVPRVAALGGSAGAPSVMQLCLRHPERCSAMILAVPLAFKPRPADQPEETSPLMEWVIKTTLRSDFIFWTATKLARDTLIETILATPIDDFRKASPEEQERVLRILRNVAPIAKREKGLWNDTTLAKSLTRYELEKLTVPTLVFSTENDLFGTFESGRYTAEQIPGARFIGYPDGGHIWVGHNQEVWAEVKRFIEQAGP